MPDPDDHVQINLDNIQNLTIKDGELYWRREKLKTETTQHFALTATQAIGAILITVGAIAAPTVTYFAELENICKATKDSAPLCPFPKEPKEKQAAPKGSTKDAPVIKPKQQTN